MQNLSNQTIDEKTGRTCCTSIYTFSGSIDLVRTGDGAEASSSSHL